MTRKPHTLEGMGPSGSGQARKTVTILFCDLTGSTALGERLDPEVLREVIQQYFADMRSVVEQHGGTVEKFIGDAVMAVFGVPRVREDDALRAAADMQTALDAANEGLERDYGTRLQARIGIHTGEVMRLAREAVDRGWATDYWALRTMPLEALSTILFRTGRSDEARANLMKAIAVYEAKGHTVGAAAARRLLAERPDMQTR